MSEDAERYERVAQGFTTRLSGVQAEQWESPTPCTEWTVRDLVAHVVDTHHRVLSTLDGSEPVSVDADGDLTAQWTEVTGEILAAVQDPERGPKVVRGFTGEAPFESLVGGLACSDTIIHTWDLARATGQDEKLDPSAIAHCQILLEGFGEGIRRPGGFSAAIPTAPDADAQMRFLHFTGRRV
jgi:uncharacterized protein (TIGR03086 family)